MKKVLVVCTGNSARSQLAEGYIRYFAGDRAHVYSAGISPQGVNPVAIQVMKEDGIDIAHHTSNHLCEYENIDFDLVLTVCDKAKEQCPYFPSTTVVIHYSFADPGHTPDEDLLTSFRRVRDEITAYSKVFVEQHIVRK
jgi:arsenate reductase